MAHVQFRDKMLESQLMRRTGKGGSTGLTAGRLLRRYLDLCQDALPTLRLGEWCAICDAMNGIWMHDGWSPRYLWVEISETEGLGEKWGIDQEALVTMLRGASLATTLAIVDVVEQFWSREDWPTDIAADKAVGDDPPGGPWHAAFVLLVGAEHIHQEVYR